MPNVLTNFGLAMQGADRSRAVQQDFDAGEQNMAAGRQRQALVGQQIETGEMGLEEARRARSVQAATRGAGATAIGAGKTISGSLLDMSDAAAKMGDVATAQQYRDAHKQLESMGAKEVVNAALMDPRPGDRPDLLQIMHQYEKTKDTTGATLDETGNLVVTRSSAPPTKLPIGKLAELMGMMQPPKIHNIPAGGVGVMTQPGKAPIQIAAPKTYAENPQQGYEKRTMKDADGNERTQIIDIRETIGGKPNPAYGKEVGADAAGGLPAGAGGTNVRKDLPVLKEISQGIIELGEEYGKTDMSNPLNPKITLTPKGQQVAMVAEQIRLANQSLAPRTVIEMAVKGKPMWKVEDGKRSGVVIYGGQEFPMSTPAARTAAAPRPAAAPAAAPAPGAPAAAPPAPAQPVVAASAEATTRKFDQVLEAKSPELKRLGNLLRLKPKDPNLDTQGWIAYAALAKKLGGQGFARGGKVSRKMCHGLG